MKRAVARTIGVALLAAAAAGGCSDRQKVISFDLGFDGTCVRCHDGLRAGHVHATFKLRCVDCHGGNDQVFDVPALAHQDPDDFRNPDLIKESHVRPKPGLARFFWANGIDDDEDGVVDEGPVFDDINNPTRVEDFGEIAELNLHGEGVGFAIDSELNRDLNYTRWQNPGDLRVATITCGSLSRPALDGEGGGVCHQSVVETMRRSLMVSNGAVINGAFYGNESWRGTFQTARDAVRLAGDPRAGAFGYVLDYAAIDSDCITLPDLANDVTGRAQPSFNSACLEAKAAARDPNAAAGAPGNVGLPAFEAVQGVILPAPGVEAGYTLAHVGAGNSRLPWGGNPLEEPAAALPQLQSVPDEDVVPGVPDPVDNILRGFRAYYPLNYPGTSSNFVFTFGEGILPGIDEFKTDNPFGRGHSSGCTACHMAYNFTGARDPQLVLTEGSGDKPVEVVDPTTKHREFDPETQDIVGGELVGMAVNAAERQATGREQQRFYSARHQMTTQITTEQCSLCHAFVTRMSMAYQGFAEPEQREEMARRAPIEFSTRRGTRVRILDSWIREQQIVGQPPGTRELILPEGLEIVALAKARDAELDALGLIAGGGGCAPTVFTEDCNNNGELDNQLVLSGRDAAGNLVSTIINEDLNGNGKLDLIDHVPREFSVDGRQTRYVYGGANGSTRLMDVHFELGMHCIDCHFLQDVHGDGNIYTTNWEQIEIECEDCHGTHQQRATLITSGANGGNDLTRGFDHDGRPFFERRGGAIIQRSRVTSGLEWEVMQVADTVQAGHPSFNPRAVEAHRGAHMPKLNQNGRTAGSTFAGPGAGAGERGELEIATLECYTCHNSWVLNCMGCHYQMNLGDPVNKIVAPDGTISKGAGQNEVWFNNRNQAGATNFQLLSLFRSPMVLGYNAAADGHRLAPFRSSMLTHVSVTGPGGHTLIDNTTFTTFLAADENTGQSNVAVSGAVFNQTMPHTVRRAETRDCETCHALVDAQGRIRNDHILAETYGLGAGRYPYVGDWVLAAGTGGIELFEYKQEQQLKDSKLGSPGASSRYPGIIVNPTDAISAKVEPVLDGTSGVGATFVGTDIAFLRNFTALPDGPGGTSVPSLCDLAIATLSNGSAGKLMIADVTGRGHPDSVRPSEGNADKVEVVDLPDRAFALATLSPDISDPFVYVANGGAGLTIVELQGPGPVRCLTGTGDGPLASVVQTVGIPGNPGTLVATEVVLAGDVAYVGTQDGKLAVFDLHQQRGGATHVTTVELGTGQVNGLALAGFVLYAATANGLVVLDISNPMAPVTPTGAGAPLALSGFAGHELFHSGGHVYVAAGSGGVLDVDVTTPAAPRNLGDIVSAVAGQTVDARDVIVSKVPGQTWLLIADGAGDLLGLKLPNLETKVDCAPDPVAAGCGLNMDWRDPTIMGRDPSVDPVTKAPDAGDPSAAGFFRMPGAILTQVVRLARPAIWERIGSQTGRALRDSFMPGSGVLSLAVMRKLYSGVQVCEVAGSEDVDGNGLGELGYAGQGECVSLAAAARAEAGKALRTQWLQELGRVIARFWTKPAAQR
jgi:hypothetical protein